MKSKLLIAVFTLIVFLAGTFFGFYTGTSAAAGSNVSQLYGGSLELSAVHSLIEREEYESAQDFICTSLKTRMNVLKLALPTLGSRKASEVDNFMQGALAQNIDASMPEMTNRCP